MALNEILGELATIFRAVAGVTRVDQFLPNSVNSTDVPYVVLMPAFGDLSSPLNNVVKIDHSIIVRCYISAPGLDIDAGARLEDITPFLRLFQTAMAASIRLDSLAGVNNSWLDRYEFPPNGGYEYVDFTLRVQERYQVTFDE